MNQETKTNKTGFTTKSITMMALFAAILCISAYISIPLPIPGSPHITLLNFVIIVIALLFPLSQSFITILVWMALGAIGLPVFIGGGSGIGYFRWIHILFLSDRHCTSTDPRQKIQSNPIHSCCYCRRCIDRYHRNALLEG